MMISSSQFNDNQRKAMEWDKGPLLVVAGTGSGKTLVLTHRIARLIESSPNNYYKILGLTFTDKAAAEIRNRITELLPNSEQRIKLTTFHSFAVDMLRRHGHHINIKLDFTILSQDADRLAVLDDAIKAVGNGKSYRTSAELLRLVTRLVDNNVSPDQAIHILKHRFNDAELLARIYANYRSLMIESNVLDFPTLIAETLDLFKKCPAIKKLIYPVYRYVCVDEFQDINFGQYKLLQNLVNPETKNIFVMADENQIIHQWNGASSERLQKLYKNFSMEITLLPENYRCPPKVVELANKLIFKRNTNFRYTGLPSPRNPSNSQPMVQVENFSAFNEEVYWVARDISKRQSNSPGSFVVLARTNKLLASAVDALKDIGVEGFLGARKIEFDSESMKWLHAILRLANSRCNREYLRIVCESFNALEKIDLDLEDVISHASAENIDFLQAWKTEVLNCSGLSDTARNFVETSLPNLSDCLDYRTFSDDAFKWLNSIHSESNCEHRLNEYEEEKRAWCEITAEIMKNKQDLTLNHIFQQLDLRSKASTPSEGSVPCFTIHSSKGMGFDHVYLIGMVENHFPSWQAIQKGEDSQEIEEERRNCFAAITRTHKRLTITYSNNMYGKMVAPSRFLREMELLS